MRTGICKAFRLFFKLFLFLCFITPVFSQKVDELISIKVFADQSAISSNSEIQVAVLVNLEPGWHVYWSNAGDSGYPTQIQWNLPRDWELDPLEFPVPYLYEFEGMKGFALDNNFTLLARIRAHDVAKSAHGKKVKFGGTFTALVCNETTCLPFETEFSLDLSQSEVPLADIRGRKIVDSARAVLPVPLPSDARAKAFFHDQTGLLSISHSSLRNVQKEKFRFFSEDPMIIFENSPIINGDEAQFIWKTIEGREAPTVLSGVLVLAASNEVNGWKVSVSIEKGGVSLIPSQSEEMAEKVRDEYALLRILLLLVFLSMAAWAYGRASNHFTNRRLWSLLVIGSLLIGAWVAFPKHQNQGASQIQWREWTKELEVALLADGQALFVDYTAKWCLSCQVNKGIYREKSVEQAFMDGKVNLLRADWTKKNPEILHSLQSYGREGVPFCVYYPSGRRGEASEPIYLPEILSVTGLIDVIEGRLPNKDHGFVSSANFTALLGLAWLGGLILNLMPCVFPVIGLKILGFVRQAGNNRDQISLHGWVFTSGVLLSFWILVGLLLFLRIGLEENLGWGFQLQEPAFVLVLAVLLFLFGLSLSGVFELGTSFTGLGASLASKAGLWGSFFSGVLATVVATPCMAPFLGVAVGAALTMPALPSFAIFTCIGLGLSTPYLLLSFFPAWLQRLPKPGPWMEAFKQFMAFPVYATVAWLVWTLDGLL